MTTNHKSHQKITSKKRKEVKIDAGSNKPLLEESEDILEKGGFYNHSISYLANLYVYFKTFGAFREIKDYHNELMELAETSGQPLYKSKQLKSNPKLSKLRAKAHLNKNGQLKKDRSNISGATYMFENMDNRLNLSYGSMSRDQTNTQKESKRSPFFKAKRIVQRKIEEEIKKSMEDKMEAKKREMEDKRREIETNKREMESKKANEIAKMKAIKFEMKNQLLVQQEYEYELETITQQTSRRTSSRRTTSDTFIPRSQIPSKNTNAISSFFGMLKGLLFS